MVVVIKNLFIKLIVRLLQNGLFGGMLIILLNRRASTSLTCPMCPDCPKRPECPTCPVCPTCPECPTCQMCPTCSRYPPFLFLVLSVVTAFLLGMRLQKFNDHSGDYFPIK